MHASNTVVSASEYVLVFILQQDGSFFLSLSPCLQCVEAHWSDVSEELGRPHLQRSPSASVPSLQVECRLPSVSLTTCGTHFKKDNKQILTKQSTCSNRALLLCVLELTHRFACQDNTHANVSHRFITLT